MGELLSFGIMQRALACGVLVGFVAGYFGVFVVQRRMAFLGSGLAHAAFGGIALGILASVPPIYAAIPFTVIVAIAIVWVRERSALAEDTSIGVLFSVSMALGVVFIALKKGFAGDALAYLFGSIVAVSAADVWLALAMAGATIATVPLWGAWAYAAFDRNLARTDRLPAAAHDYALAVAMAVAIVVSIKIVGILLISAFLVLPAAAARMMSRSFRQMTVLSILIGTTTPAVGLYASYVTDLPSGATIILIQAAVFAAALGARRPAA
ncbi:MAG: metal ABC transporter permease [Candidatus Hydrogenedentes bacterium]|nr:metal ABC transporter permease [Candidatus Hydrogenedentota bacterium]